MSWTRAPMSDGDLVQIVYLCAAVLALSMMVALGIHATRLRHMHGAPAIAAVSVCMAAWIGCVLMISISEPDEAVVWDHLRRFVASLGTWIAFWGAVDIAGLRPPGLRWLQWASLVPLLVRFLAIWPFSGHAWLFSVATFERRGMLTAQAELIRGPLFVPYLLYVYGLLLAAMVVIAYWAVIGGRLARKQGLTIGAALAIAFVTHIASYFGKVAIDLNWMPIGLAFSAAIVGYAMIRHRMLALSPVSRHVLFDAIELGVLATDRAGRVVDLNPAMVAICGVPAASAIGRRFVDLLGPGGDLRLRMAAGPEGIALEHNGRLYAVRPVPFSGPGGVGEGQLYLFRDDTERRRVEGERDRLIAELRDVALEVQVLRSEPPGAGRAPGRPVP
jgi:PAS domain-containing protein